MTKWIVYSKFGKKIVNFWRDERAYKSEAYAKRVAKNNQPFWKEELKVKAVEVHRCPECGTRLIDQ